MKQSLRHFLTAFRFLTIIPLPWMAENDSECFPDSVKYFGVVGLCIGIFGSILVYLLSALLPSILLCSILLLYFSLISGFLHLDGVADTADGFFSSRPKEKILAIMKDSRTGAMGVIALIFLLLIKFCALVSLPVEKLPVAALLVPLSGRCAIVYTMSFLPYARENGGLGKMFYATDTSVNIFVTAVIFIFTGIVINFSLAISLLCALVVVTVVFGIWCKRMIGGITGDTLGAICEIIETSAAVTLSIYSTF